MMKYLGIIALITMSLFGADKADAINKLMFDGTPPFCANHIAEADANELDIDAESFKKLHTHALASIKVRADDLQSRLQALSLDDSGTLAQEKELMTYARNITFSTHTFIASLAKKYETNPAKVSTQDILRCAQWAKQLENDDNSIKLTFHHGIAWNTSTRVLARNSIGGILANHEWIERSKYGSDAAQYAARGVDSGEVTDANLDFFDNVTYETFEPETTPTGHPFVWGEGKLPSQKVIDEFDEKARKGPQGGVTSMKIEPSAAISNAPSMWWQTGGEPSQAMVDRFDAQAKKGPQKGIISMPAESSNQ